MELLHQNKEKFNTEEIFLCIFIAAIQVIAWIIIAVFSSVFFMSQITITVFGALYVALTIMCLYVLYITYKGF